MACHLTRARLLGREHLGLKTSVSAHDSTTGLAGADFDFNITGSTSEVTFSHGPEYFSSIKAPNPEGSLSTRSDSKRSSVNQVCSICLFALKP
jgi:hypothetical protein